MLGGLSSLRIGVPTSLLPLLPLLPLGLVAGLLAGVLGIGGGLIFAPLLLLAGYPPHVALATSTLAIVPTSLAACRSQRAQGKSRPGQANSRRALVAIGVAAAAAGPLFGWLGDGLADWQLLGLQALLYLGLTLTIAPSPEGGAGPASPTPTPPPGGALAAVGGVAGIAAGLLGVGGGLVMVPLLVRLLGLPIHGAVRLSTVAVLASASSSSLVFVADGRADVAAGVLLGSTAALAAHWSAARLDRLAAPTLARLLRGLTGLLGVVSAWRALALLMG
jgi:uncharacterized membrane protein YfcA